MAAAEESLVTVVIIEILEVRIVSEGIVTRVLGQTVSGSCHGSRVLPLIVAEGHLVLITSDTHRRLSVREQVLRGVLVEAAEVSDEEVLGVGLVHGAGPDGGRGRQGMIKLVAGHRGDGGVGLGGPAGRHQTSHHLGTLRTVTSLAVLLHHADDDEDEDEDHDDAEADDEDQDGGGLCGV